jgi:hypothetical protein
MLGHLGNGGSATIARDAIVLNNSVFAVERGSIGASVAGINYGIKKGKGFAGVMQFAKYAPPAQRLPQITCWWMAQNSQYARPCEPSTTVAKPLAPRT